MRASLPSASSPEHCLPRIQFLFIASRLCSTLLSDLASRFGPCASLSLHLHLVVKRTCTSQLSIMLGTIGIGGTVTRPPLPHHCRCGSAYGGSGGYARPSKSRGRLSASK